MPPRMSRRPLSRLIPAANAPAAFGTALADALQLLKVERDLALALARCETPEDCLRALLNQVLRLQTFDCGGAYLFDDDKGVLRLAAHQGLSVDFVARVTELGPDSPQVQLVRTGEVFCAAAHELHPNIAAGLAKEGIRSLVVLPLACGGRLIGCLNLASRTVAHIPPSAHATVERIAEFADTLLIAIHSQRQRLERLVEERTRELAAANAQLASQAETLNMALEASEASLPDVDLLTGEVRFDPRGLLLTGYEDANARITLEQTLRERVHPSSREEMIRQLGEIADPSGPSRWEHEFMINHPTRGLRWIGGRGTVFRDETGRAVRLFGMVFDITERKLAEEILRDWSHALEIQVAARTRELRASEGRFRSLVEAAFEGVVISSDQTIIDANPQAAAMFGYEPAEMVGRPVLAFVAPESAAQLAAHLRANPTEPFPWQGLKKDGSTFPIVSRSRIEKRAGRAIRVSAIRDLTAEMQTQAHLQDLRMELERATGLALISEVSQGILHQISQPLTVMGNQIEVALTRLGRCASGGCHAAEVVDAMHAELHQIREVVSHLRSLAAPTQAAYSPTSLNQVIEHLLPLLLRDGSAAGIAIHTALDASVPEISANAVQLRQVLINLVRNAIEACASSRPPDGGTVRISTRHVAGVGVKIAVRDNGPGFAPGIAERLFTPFLTTKPHGNGIGLRLCQRIIKAHRGTIEGHPNPNGVGVSFLIHLPLPSAGGR